MTVVELRQYTVYADRRDDLAELFDAEFVESQEALGMTVLGQFHDLRRPDRYVWLRGFPDLPSRPKSLAAFYGGPVWAAHKDAANATMINFDDVLLLRPLQPFPPGTRPPRTAAPASRPESAPASRVVATIHLAAEPWTTFPEPDAPVLAAFTTLYATNEFPALPVRENVHAYVWFTRFDTAAEADAFLQDRRIGDETLLLAPTPRSLVR